MVQSGVDVEVGMTDTLQTLAHHNTAQRDLGRTLRSRCTLQRHQLALA
jgi:hypothetical protein